MFSRFSTKNLSLGRLNELFEISTFDKLKTLLSQGAKAESEQIIKINYDDMNGYQFEKFCAEILRKNGFENIELTQGSGDHGIDILAEKDNITYAIQCKCYSSNIGNSAVQQAHTGKSLYHKDIAVVITNRYFTTQAIEEAEALGVKLWDRDYLNNFVNAVRGICDAKDKKPNENELNKILLDVAEKISDVFKSSQINATIINIDCKENETSFWVQPPQGAGIETIFLCKKEIEFELKMPIQIRAISEKAYIRIYVQSKDLENYTKQNEDTERANEEGNWKKFEKYHEQLVQALLGMGKVYVNLFDENLNIKPYIADMQRIDEKTSKFILRCENSEQAKAIKETEGILNQGINAEHEIEIINDTNVSLLVKFE